MVSRGLLAGGAIFCFAHVSGCSQMETAQATTPLKECRVVGVESAVRCATIEVPENRAVAQGRKIAINVVVLPATARSKHPDPIFFFAGGPSQAASDFARPALTMFAGLNTKRDIVLVDQRGTGKSNGLFCKSGDAWEIAAMEPDKRERLSVQELSKCRADLLQKADLTQYTTTIAMADIEAVRAALGYPQINLWGGSYGTRAAQEYLRRYPDKVRSVILDGVAPPALVLPANFSRDADAALLKGLDACTKDKACTQRYTSFEDDLRATMAALRRSPVHTTVADPYLGTPRKVILDDKLLSSTIFATLYSPEALALVPYAIDRAKRGDFAPWAALTSLLSNDMDDKNAMGMRLSVVCAEDIPRLEKSRPQFGEFFGDFFVREFSKACTDWPRGDVPSDFFTPVKSDKPVLILSGALDPVTPPQYGEEVKNTFTNSVHLVAPQLGHGVSLKGCAPKLIKQFVEAGRVDALDGKCLERLPRPMYFEPLEERKNRSTSVESHK